MVIERSRREFLKQASLLAAASGAILKTAGGADQKFVVADTAFGKIRGVDADGIKTFKGIPYGANTTGKNRFMPPVDPAKWTEVRDALQFGPSAPQTEPGVRRATSDTAVAGAGLTAESEACLVLNVWTPAVNDGKKRPVMFWCHGGGFATGSGSPRSIMWPRSSHITRSAMAFTSPVEWETKRMVTPRARSSCTLRMQRWRK